MLIKKKEEDGSTWTKTEEEKQEKMSIEKISSLKMLSNINNVPNKEKRSQKYGPKKSLRGLLSQAQVDVKTNIVGFSVEP